MTQLPHISTYGLWRPSKMALRNEMTAGSPAKFPDNAIVAPYTCMPVNQCLRFEFPGILLGMLYSYGTAFVRAVYNLKQEYTAEIQ